MALTSITRSFAKCVVAFAFLFVIVSTLSFQVVFAQPEINVERPALTTIIDGGTDAQGNVAFAQSTVVTYTVRNTGSSNLVITDFSSTNTSNVTVNNIDPSGFGSLFITPGGTREFDVTYTVTAAGGFSFELDIVSDDSDEGNYDITVSGTGVNSPEIDALVFDGVLTPVANGGSTDVGNRNTNFLFSDISVTLENNGTATLNISGVSSSNASNIVVTNVHINNSSISAGLTESVFFDYEVQGAGAFSFDIIIDNDDPDEDPYVITLTGTGAPTPKIQIERPSGNTIADGGSDPQGDVPSGNPFSQSLFYTVRNIGSGTLNVTSTGINFITNMFGGSANPNVFSLNPGETQVVEVTYIVSADGPFEFEVEWNNDSFENPLQTYTISVTGTGVTGPEIDLQRPAATSISDGGSDATGAVPINAQTTLTYTIENTGNQALVVSNIASSGETDVTVDNISPTSFGSIAAGGGTDTFDVTFTPSAIAFSFQLEITNNDADEGTYSITVSGSGAGVGVPGSGDADGNGVADIIDARICLQIALGEISGTAAQIDACDVNGDSAVTREDAEIIAEFDISLRGSLAALGILAGFGLFLGLPILMLISRKRRSILAFGLFMLAMAVMVTGCTLFPPGTTSLIAIVNDNFITITVQNMPNGGLAAFSADAGGFTFDPNVISVNSVQALAGFDLLASQIDNANGEVRWGIANPSGGVVSGAILIMKITPKGGFFSPDLAGVTWARGNLTLADDLNVVIAPSAYQIFPNP